MQRIFRNMSVVLPSGFETVKLSAIFKKVSRRNNKSEIKNVITNSAEYGLIPQRDFFDKDIAVDGNTSNYYVIEQGDFVYNPRKSNTAPYGPFNRYEREERGIISPLYTCLVLQADPTLHGILRVMLGIGIFTITDRKVFGMIEFQ